MVWNVNGISDSKNDLHGILDYLNTFDVVMLVETRVESIDKDFLLDYSIAHIPASKSGKAGQGILLGYQRMEPRGYYASSAGCSPRTSYTSGC